MIKGEHLKPYFSC